jgi:hypothetical protein
MIIPINAIYSILPNFVKSVDVVYPSNAIAPNVPAVIKNVIAIEDELYARKIKLRLMPVSRE